MKTDMDYIAEQCAEIDRRQGVKPTSSCMVDSVVGCLKEILCYAHIYRGEPLVDIANDAFLSHGIPLSAGWSGDSNDPISLTPNVGLTLDRDERS